MPSSTKQGSSLVLAGVATAVAAAVGLYAYKKITSRNKNTDPTARIFADKQDVAKELCEFIAESAREAIQERGVFHLAVAGGSLLDLLSQLVDHKDTVDFSKVVLSFANHKCVPPTDPKATMAKSKAKFADACGIKIIVAPTSQPKKGSDGSSEALYYSEALVAADLPHSQKYPVLDMILLGLGADGHVGSCHPLGPAVLETKKAVAGSPKSGEPSSITLTIETINKARQICAVVCGGTKGKKEAVKRAMTRPAEEPRGTFPAQLLEAPLFFLDSEAAAEL